MGPDMTRFLGRLAPGLAASFSPEQLAAVELHFAMRARVGHVVDVRRQVRLGPSRYYVVVLAGRERSSG